MIRSRPYRVNQERWNKIFPKHKPCTCGTPACPDCKKKPEKKGPKNAK